MEVGSVERMLRETPGVLDCSMSDEGIAVVVHPEVDPRMLELRIQAALADLGEVRPLLVVGGMSTAGGAFPATSGPRRHIHRPGPAVPRPPRARSSMPILGVAVLVVAAITLVPLAGRNSSSGGDRSTRAGEAAAGAPLPTAGAPGEGGPGPTFGSLAVVDEVSPGGAVPERRVSAASTAVLRATGRPDPEDSVGPLLVAALPAASSTATSAGVGAPAVTPPAPSVAAPGRSAARAGKADTVESPRAKRSKRVEAASAPDRVKGDGRDKHGGGRDKGRGGR